MKKKIIVTAAVGGTLAISGIAWATLSGVLVTPDVVQGLINGGGSGSCQTGGITFTVPEPTWSNSDGDYMVSDIAYSQIAAACVTLGTADLVLNITDGSTNSIANATASDMGNTSGNLTLSNSITFDEAVTGQYFYLVKDN